MASSIHRPALVTAKIGFGLLAFSSIVSEIATIVERGTWVPENFFAYFTIETNMLVVLSLLLSAVATAANAQGARINAFRAAVTVYILIVGIGFALLLSGLTDVDFTAVPWNNTVLHYVMPVVMLIDLLIDRPAKRIRFGTALIWLIFPAGYAAFSLVRGNLIGWYPYPFLNPTEQGYAPVVLTIIGLVVLGVALTWLVTLLSRRPGKSR
ncbi:MULTISPECIES: Pr6Pr family membrane protein [unclassified Pseudoclavibacter]|uniref:Pr6Pr family membrane protein n=1 Tax=unclassified Pseudoclavibacter TaxID=2615177 RepID=UPI0015CCFBB8|nr:MULTISPECIES: Pr6Pr family membrane protein [unclassified Pseudoclavibacter]MBS3177186.1 Pr6Pr family membrane protein [Pseudoclavibacter sp. Marseille-Q4354]NYF12980.1 putative membrane protein [Pseudoclavibacter sp. JAI123]